MNLRKLRRNTIRFFKVTLTVICISFLVLALTGTVVQATGLVDDTINVENLYSKYPLSSYQLDFFVDNSWAWLPWNWIDGIGKSVQYGLYAITNFIWIISLYLSNATGYVVQEAYKLNFINDMADNIGNSMQTLAGVTKQGFSNIGFYNGFLLLIVLIVGIYVTYAGLIKRETSKAVQSMVNFLVIFILSTSLIAFAPEYIKKVNDFSSDISTASLDLGTKVLQPNHTSSGKDSVNLIRDSLFSIQVEQPWLLLQFGNSNREEVGNERVDTFLSAGLTSNDETSREDIVKAEIEERGNDNLTIPQVINRLGMVFFLLIFNLGITIFIFLLTAFMIFSQILFIIFAMFLPISFLLSMLPTYNGMAKKAIIKLFNTIMIRAGITLIVTIAFSISSMFYNISGNYPFFMVAFLQIVTFAGIYMKLGDLMSIFSLQSNDSQAMVRKIGRRPFMFMRHRVRQMERQITKTVRNNKEPSNKDINRRKRANETEVKRSTPYVHANTRNNNIMNTKDQSKDKAMTKRKRTNDVPTIVSHKHSKLEEKQVGITTGSNVKESQVRSLQQREKSLHNTKNITEKRRLIKKMKPPQPITTSKVRDKHASNSQEHAIPNVQQGKPRKQHEQKIHGKKVPVVPVHEHTQQRHHKRNKKSISVISNQRHIESQHQKKRQIKQLNGVKSPQKRHVSKTMRNAERYIPHNKPLQKPYTKVQRKQSQMQVQQKQSRLQVQRQITNLQNPLSRRSVYKKRNGRKK